MRRRRKDRKSPFRQMQCHDDGSLFHTGISLDGYNGTSTSSTTLFWGLQKPQRNLCDLSVTRGLHIGPKLITALVLDSMLSSVKANIKVRTLGKYKKKKRVTVEQVSRWQAVMQFKNYYWCRYYYFTRKTITLHQHALPLQVYLVWCMIPTSQNQYLTATNTTIIITEWQITENISSKYTALCKNKPAMHEHLKNIQLKKIMLLSVPSMLCHCLC